MDNCDLSKLTVKPGKLVPKFSPKVTEYTVTLPTDVAETKFGPLTSDNGASYTIKVCALRFIGTPDARICYILDSTWQSPLLVCTH